ncbi:sulfurtransferase [Lampropedia cohaerens]|uniref:Sulfurtransferase n=1 Tax=Lampropedia cohaerens TaxID=1610491 RepID=A0A0U1PWF6_9BURK|nr:rhodanese-like domain-containing protein [Lampropedia cohaerens]KKW66849.1 sulfurtransferase [Lampropedia cohaerens]
MSFFLDNWYLFLLAGVSGALLFVPSLMRAGASGLTPAQAVQKINSEKAIVVDVRTAEEYAAGHIKGARHVLPEQLDKQIGAVAKNKAAPLLFVCASGTRAARAAAAAKKLGYENVYVVTGGMKAWKDASLPVTAGAKPA